MSHVENRSNKKKRKKKKKKKVEPNTTRREVDVNVVGVAAETELTESEEKLNGIELRWKWIT